MSARFETDSMKDLSLRMLTNSGGNYYQDIYFQSGKVFAGNSMTTGGLMNFVANYRKDSPFDFEIKYKSGKYSFYCNNIINLANKQILNSQVIQDSAAKPLITGFLFSGRGEGLTGSLSVYGDTPGLYFSPLYSYQSQTGLYSGYIIISGHPGRLNSISSDNAFQFSIPSSLFTSGDYILSGLNFSSGAFINADFDFNFGTISQYIYFDINQNNNPGSFINFSSTSDGIYYSGLPHPVQYQDYISTASFGEDSSFQPSLEFLYRSGNILISGTGTMTGYLTGYISGSGYLYGTATGYTYNGTYSQRGAVINLPNFNESYTGNFSEFAFGTGYVVYNYDIPVTGRERYIFGADDSTTGRLTGILTGLIGPGSGYYDFYQYITGRPVYWSGSYQTGDQSIGEYYSPSSLVSEYVNDYELENYTGLINRRVYWTGYVSKLETSPFTGNYVSGFYSNNSGYISGFNLLTGDPGVLTGDFSYVYDNYYNYTGNSNVSGRFLIKEPIYASRGVYEYGLRVTYDRNIPQEVSDYFLISVNGGGSVTTFTGRGQYL
jgi:hypothetical protein